MNAIIYAAGRATRLGPAYVNHAKIMLEFGRKSLLEWHVESLKGIGVRRVMVVTGHLREQVKEVIPVLATRYGIEIVEQFNPDFGEGSVLSVNVSVPEIQRAGGSILLMDGDVLYEPAVLQRLVNSQHPTALLIDRDYSSVDDDPVLVPIRKGRPFEFLKRWKGKADAVGESVGFFKISESDIPLLLKETNDRSRGLRRLDSYDEIISALVKAGRFAHEDVTGCAWTEIDFPHDIARAREEVLSALQPRRVPWPASEHV